MTIVPPYCSLINFYTRCHWKENPSSSNFATINSMPWTNKQWSSQSGSITANKSPSMLIALPLQTSNKRSNFNEYMTDISGVTQWIKLFYDDQQNFITHPSPPNSTKPHWTIITMDEALLLSKGNLAVVGKNPPGKPFHEGVDAFILDLSHANGVLCQFVLCGK